MIRLDRSPPLLLAAALFAMPGWAAPIPKDKSERTQEIYLRCLYDMGEFGSDALQVCINTDTAAAEKLLQYPPEAQPVVDRCFSVRWTHGYGSVLACVEKDMAATQALAAYGPEHAGIIMGCSQGVGQQGAAKVKDCVDAALAGKPAAPR